MNESQTIKDHYLLQSRFSSIFICNYSYHRKFNNVIIPFFIPYTMIINYKSYHQPTHPISIPRQVKNFPITRNVTDKSESNTPNQESQQAYTDQRKGNGQIQNCSFKIRTFSTKTNNKRNSIQGKQLKNVMVIEGNKTILQIKEQETMNKCIEKQRANKNYMVRPRKQHKNETVFNSISIVKTNQKKSIAFKCQDNSFIKPLSYRPTIKWNQGENYNVKNLTEIIVIVSLRCFNNQPTKYWKNIEKGFYSQKSVQTSTNGLSLQCMNMLRTLSGQSSKESWLNKCNLFYKVENQKQLSNLYDFLIENKLTNFTGIINCQKKTSENYNIYSLQHLLQKDSHLILIENYDTLQSQLPVLQNQKFMCISSKVTNSVNIYSFINCLKDVNLEFVTRKNGSYQRSFNYDSQKENIDYNTAIPKSSSNLIKKKELQKLANSPQIFLQINLNLEMDYLQLQTSRLSQMTKHALKTRQLRKMMKQMRHKSAQNRKQSLQTSFSQKPVSREKYTSKNDFVKEEQSPRQQRFGVDFKDKLFKLVKILEYEKKNLKIQRRLQTRRQSDNQAKKQSNDLQYLTECLTTKLKCKTGYQLVGDLVRNNIHINRQVNKYFNQVKAVSQFFTVQSDENKRLDLNRLQEKELRGCNTLPVYTF